MVSGDAEVGDAGVARDPARLLEEADDHVCRWADGVEDVTRVDHEVHIPLQDLVYRPPVRLLRVYLSLVTVRFRVKPRVAGVPQVRIRDMRHPHQDAALLSHPFDVGQEIEVVGAKAARHLLCQVALEGLVWVHGTLAASRRSAHRIEGVVNAVGSHTRNVLSYPLNRRGLRHEAAHDVLYLGCKVQVLPAEDLRSGLARENRRSREASEDGHRVMGVPEEKAALLELKQLVAGRGGERAVA